FCTRPPCSAATFHPNACTRGRRLSASTSPTPGQGTRARLDRLDGTPGPPGDLLVRHHERLTPGRNLALTDGGPLHARPGTPRAGFSGGSARPSKAGIGAAVPRGVSRG